CGIPATVRFRLARAGAGTQLLAARARRDVGFALERLHLRGDVILEDVAGDVHERVAVVGVDAHAREARVVVVQQAGLLCGVVRRDAHQPRGDVARAAARRVALDLGGGDGARLRV